MNSTKKTIRSLQRSFVVGAVAAIQTTLLIPMTSAHAVEDFEPLFNGQNLNGWYTWDDRYNKNNDIENYYKVENGDLVILDIPESSEDKAFGYIGTNDEYENYHLRFEYRWEDKKFAPRIDRLRDSGVLYHLTGNDRIWPTSLESQVQEGDTGDFFGLGGTNMNSTVDGSDYSPTGDVENIRRLRASSVADTLEGWNTSEVIVRGDSAVHIVNGQVVNRLWDATADGDPLTSGRIAFQAEGATIRYRNIELRKLASDSPRVLIYSETREFRHGSISNAVTAIEELAESANIETDSASDSSGVFTDANLANYDAVIWVMTTGDVLDDDEQAAFEHYIRSGGGYAGIHSASDTEYDWPWYGSLVGAYFDRHPSVQSATQNVEDDSHQSTAHLGSQWTRTDEWYDYQSNPRSNVNVLLSLDEDSYSGGGMGNDHPSAWYHEYDGGRSWYTGGGHTSASYLEDDFRSHLLGGIRYAAGVDSDEGVEPPEPPDGTPPIPADALDRDDWTVTASVSRTQQRPENAIDGNVNTRWSTGQVQSADMSFDIDFGESVSFDGIVLDSGESATDYPRGYEVRISDDGSNFSRVIASGNGRDRGTIINFATETARYVRIVQTGSDNRRWWSIHEINVSAADSTNSTELDRGSWNATASITRRSESPSSAFDLSLNSRWSTGTPQSGGEYYQLDLGQATQFDRIVLSTSSEQPLDYPRDYEVLVSSNGQDFGSPIASGAGSSTTDIRFDPTTARYVRIVQTGTDSRRWWSIYNMQMFITR